VRACHEEDLEAIAVYSAADRAAPTFARRSRDRESGRLRQPSSYLNIERLLEAAAAAGADGIHPGYGFLAERAVFARQCQGRG
jgi:acetyl/propionyl-CoA carboxylase alpha subunit